MKAFLEKGGTTLFSFAYALFRTWLRSRRGRSEWCLPGLAVLSFIVYLPAVGGRLRRDAAYLGRHSMVIAMIFPWLLLLHLRGEDKWLNDFIWIHNVQNYALEPIGHVRPFYYYFFNLPPDFLPWTLLLPGAVIFYYPWVDRLKDPASLALTCWFTVTFVFFTLSKSKIAYYLRARCYPQSRSLRVTISGR